MDIIIPQRIKEVDKMENDPSLPSWFNAELIQFSFTK